MYIHRSLKNTCFCVFTLPVSWPIWTKFGVYDLAVIPLGNGEFRGENIGGQAVLLVGRKASYV